MGVAAGQFPCLYIYGDDYDTPDGTGVRDYIHVEDLAEGHLRALELLEKGPRLDVFNLGTGRGYSVKEVVEAIPARYRDRDRLQDTAAPAGGYCRLLCGCLARKRGFGLAGKEKPGADVCQCLGVSQAKMQAE